MITAVFDNPATMCREAWKDGRLVAFISARLMFDRDFFGDSTMHMALNCGKWEEGKVRGDVEAIAENERPATQEGDK